MSRLKKFDYRIRDNRKRNILLISICLLTIVVVGIKLYRSYAKFEVETTEYEVINGTVVEPINAVEYLTSIVDDNPNTMFVDDTPDENIRYMGANPNNYVKFNNELWRIIGVMNNVDGGVVSGDDASRVKIIRAESLGEFPYYDECADENWTDNGDGTYTCSALRFNNNWPNSTVNEILTTYYNNGTHAAYHGTMYINNKWINYPTTAINFTSNGLNNKSKSLLETATYYLGGYNATSEDQYNYQTMISSKWYEAERTNEGNNNPLTWTGNLGLMYPSDYGYATNGGSTSNKTLCDGYALYTLNNSDRLFCKINNYLYDKKNQWTITPRTDYYSLITSLSNSGFITNLSSHHGYNISPVLYLKSTVKIVAGPNSDGSSTKPYRLTI